LGILLREGGLLIASELGGEGVPTLSSRRWITSKIRRERK